MGKDKVIVNILIQVMVLILIFIVLSESISRAEIVYVSTNTGKNILFLSSSGQVSEPILFTTGDGLWYPGFSKSKSFFVRNASGLPCKLDYIKFDLKSLVNTENGDAVGDAIYDDFIKYMKVSISNFTGIVYQGSFKDLEEVEGKVPDVIIIPSGNDIKFDAAISMDEGAKDNLENLKCVFDIIIRFSATGEDPTTPTVTPEVTPTPTVTPSTTPTTPVITPTPTITPTPVTPTETVIPEPISKIPEDTSNGKVPQTGSPIDTTTLILIGMVFTISGGILTIKKNRK